MDGAPMIARASGGGAAPRCVRPHLPLYDAVSRAEADRSPSEIWNGRAAWPGQGSWGKRVNQPQDFLSSGFSLSLEIPVSSRPPDAYVPMPGPCPDGWPALLVLFNDAVIPPVDDGALVSLVSCGFDDG